MADKYIMFFIVLALTVFMSGIAIAQVDDDDDDSDNFYDSTVIITDPTEIVPLTTYIFSITVVHGAPAGSPRMDWIYQVDLSMPSQNYVVDEMSLDAPDPLHPTETDSWEVQFEPSTSTITWQSFSLVTSANNGDIRDGEMLGFQFVATTDDAPSDGFSWSLSGDMGGQVSGIAYIGGDDDDDDDTTDDDTTDDDTTDDDTTDDDTTDDDDDDNILPDDDDFDDRSDDEEEDSGSCGC